MAVADQKKVHNITKLNQIFNADIQPQLLDFVNDAFIMELLPGITKYLMLARNKAHYKHAL